MNIIKKSFLPFIFIVLLIHWTLIVSDLGAQEYKPGDKITVMRSGQMVPATVSSVDGRWVNYEITGADGRVVTDRATAGHLNSWSKTSSTGPYKASSRTAVGFKTRNGQYIFPLRMWGKDDDSEQFEARLKTIPDDSFVLTLIKSDGTEIKVDSDELDDIDNTYLKKLIATIEKQKARTGSTGSRRPASPPSGRGGTRGGRNRDLGKSKSDSVAAASKKYPTVKVDKKSATDFKTTTTHQTAVPEWEPKNLPNVSIPFDFRHDGSHLHVDPSAPVISRDGKFAAIGVSNSIANQSKFLVFDLTLGKVVAKRKMRDCDSSIPIAFSPDNKTLVVSHELGRNYQICFWNVDTKSGTMEYKKGWKSDQRVEHGVFLFDRYLAITSNTEVVIFDVENDKVIKATSGSGVAHLASGNGYAIEEGLEKRVINLKSASKYTFSKEKNSRLNGNLGISPNGRLLALTKSSQTKILDLTNGKTLVEMSNSSNMAIPHFVGSRLLIVGSHLYDLQRRAAVAQIHSHRDFDPIATSDGTLIYVYPIDEEKFTYALVLADLLTDEVGQKVTEYTSNESVEIGPGTAINLVTNGLPPKIEAAIRTRITDAGLQISSKAEIAIEATVERLPAETVKIGDAGKLERNIRTISFTPTISHCRMLLNGKEIWGKSRTNRPGKVLRGNQGESPQMAANRLSSPMESFFVQSSFPTRLVVYGGKMPVANLSANGLQIE